MSRDETTWAPGLAALPGVSYAPPEGTSAPVRDRAEAPAINEFEFDGEVHRSLSWTIRDGSTSASPASRHAAGRDPSAPTENLLRHLHDGLAKSGTPSDYHFAIQNVIDELWRRRKDDPRAVSAIEPLCLADISLVEAYRDSFRSGDRYYATTSMDLLVTLYENAGDLDAAVTLARRVDPFLNGTGDLDRLEAKRDRLAQEDAP